MPGRAEMILSGERQWRDGERENKHGEEEDCLLTGELLTCHSALICSSSLLLCCSLEHHQLRVEPHSCSCLLVAGARGDGQTEEHLHPCEFCQ